MTDTTPARRALLTVLLDRAERGVLLPAEGPLLRALVAAEQGAADLPKAQHWRGTDGADITTAYMDAQAALARVREYARTLAAEPHPAHHHVCPDDIRAGLLGALNGPPTTPDDTPTTADDAKSAQCNATITGMDHVNSDRIIRCEKSAGHYDFDDRPTPEVDALSTGGWHSSDGGKRVWADQAPGATPATDAPQEPQP